ncbi:hypothetical protein NY2A_b678L [Paramecium bursaria Chlorella virus NY2A]|uniref:Uncharacterized protein b678L n=1 Tax=Paramecium bursaria Chlorella virus NY2A TaxID=46021 RepID=A7IXK3_PBCVN|nr:hypothetical protein NY2A_b678L [Paramecium bursaria Chlorella virus NY2A]ABT15077.1 hypothetical protein NY2A_b678L [Paramecium bursaria Chlorella virus NY2A]
MDSIRVRFRVCVTLYDRRSNKDDDTIFDLKLNGHRFFLHIGHFTLFASGVVSLSSSKQSLHNGCPHFVISKVSLFIISRQIGHVKSLFRRTAISQYSLVI